MLPRKPPRARVRLLPLGDSAWTVEFGDTVDAATNARVLGLADRLAALRAAGELPGVVETVPTFRSLTVFFDPLQTDGAALAASLRELAGQGGARRVQGRAWRLPACFDAEFAPDLGELAALRGMSPDDAVRLLTGAALRVYMIGFLPGFPYLGGLPAALDAPRLATPRTSVPARSIAVAAGLCAVYPWASPGGWRLVGRTPVGLFDANDAARPALLAPGDVVRWQAVDRAAFTAIEAEVAAGRFDPATLRDDAREEGTQDGATRDGERDIATRDDVGDAGDDRDDAHDEPGDAHVGRLA